MDTRNREALLHQVMDSLVAQVRQWKDTSHGPNAYQDLCMLRKDDIYRFFRDSGLQPWEFHTMLHRASEYGLVDDMKGLWSEVATTFLQMRSGYTTDFAQQSRQAPNSSKNSSSNGNAYSAWPTNGRSSYVKPPGLDASDRSGAVTPPGVRQPHPPYGVPPPPPAAATAGPRSPVDDTACSSSDQHNSRKQQQQAAAASKSKASKGNNQPIPDANGQVPAGQQQQLRAGAAAFVGSSKPASSDVLTNGYIAAWRDTMNHAPVPAGDVGIGGQRVSMPGYPAAASGSMPGGTGVDQQQQQQGDSAGRQSSTASTPAGTRQGSGWEVQEPLDLLPSGLLDDVYDQGDAVVDAPPSYSALASSAGSSEAVNKGGSSSGSAAPAGGPGGRGKQQQQQGGKQQRPQKQQQQPQQQQNQKQQSQNQLNAAASSTDQPPQQQSSVRQQQRQQGSQSAPRSPLPDSSTMNGISPVLAAPFSSQPVVDLTSSLSVAQHHQRPAFEPLAPQLQQQQQQQFLLLQQQARMYQQQFAGLGAWGATGHLGYVNSFAGVPVQPPPPPRSAAAAAPGSAVSSRAPAAPAAVASSGPIQQAAAKPGYAAVAAAAATALGTQSASSYKSNHEDRVVHSETADDTGLQAVSSRCLDLPLYQSQTQQSLQQEPKQFAPSAVGSAGAPGGLGLFQTAAYDSPLTPALAAGPLSPYPSPLHQSLSASAGASPVVAGIAAGSSGSSINGLNSAGLGGSGNMAPMLLPPSAATLGVIGEPVHSSSSGSGSCAGQQQDVLLAGSQPVQSWSSFGPAAVVGPPAPDPVVAPPQQHQQPSAPVGVPSMTAAAAATVEHSQQNLQLPVNSLASVSVLAADGCTSSAASSVTAPTGTSVSTTPHSQAESPAGTRSSMAPAMIRQASATVMSPTAAGADAAARQQPPPPPPPPPPRSSSSSADQQTQHPGGSSPRMQQQQPPAPPAKPLTWAQKLLRAQSSSGSGSGAGAAAAAAAAAGPSAPAVAATAAAHNASHGPRIAPAPKSELLQQAGAAATAVAAGKQRAGSTGQALLAVAKQQEAAAEAAAASAVPTFSESAALDGLDAITAKAVVSAASRMPLPGKLINAWRSGLCLASLIKLLQSQRPDLAMALNDRIKGWLTQDCDRVTAECLVLFVLVNMRRDWHLTAKSPGAFLMGLLQHRAALISSSGMGRKLLDTARNFPNVAVYIDSDVLQELGDMEPSLRSFIMDEYMCKQRHDWPEGLKFPSQCLLSCMRSIRYADPAVHKAYSNLMESRPDLGKAMNGVILYGLCKCDSAIGLAAVKRLSELPEEWTSAARVNASAFLYQKVQELCGGHCY